MLRGAGRSAGPAAAQSPSRAKQCPQRCHALISSPGHPQQPQAARVAAPTTSAPSEVCHAEDVAAPVPSADARLADLLQHLQSDAVSFQAELNAKLHRSSSWQELCDLLLPNLDLLDFVNVSTAWTRLAWLYSPSNEHAAGPAGSASAGAAAGHPGPAAGAAATPPSPLPPPRSAPPVHDPAFRQFLATLIQLTSAHLHAFGVRALANVMWAMSHADWHLAAHHQPQLDDLVHQWCVAIAERVDELRPADVSNICTAIGRLDQQWQPRFVLAFYRGVLRRTDLLDSLGVSDINNLLYGLSRASRRGLTPVGPATRARLSGCVVRLLERCDPTPQAPQQPGSEDDAETNSAAVVVSSSGSSFDGSGNGRSNGRSNGSNGNGNSSAGSSCSCALPPASAAQLLTNCHKLGLRLSVATCRRLMAAVQQLCELQPSPMDRWSFAYLTGFVAALTAVRPSLRPDPQPLLAYVERRLRDARSPSQVAMMSHALREMRCTPAPALWTAMFAPYLPAPLPGPLAAAQAQAPLGRLVADGAPAAAPAERQARLEVQQVQVQAEQQGALGQAPPPAAQQAQQRQQWQQWQHAPQQEQQAHAAALQQQQQQGAWAPAHEQRQLQQAAATSNGAPLQPPPHRRQQQEYLQHDGYPSHTQPRPEELASASQDWEAEFGRLQTGQLLRPVLWRQALAQGEPLSSLPARYPQQQQQQQHGEAMDADGASAPVALATAVPAATADPDQAASAHLAPPSSHIASVRQPHRLKPHSSPSPPPQPPPHLPQPPQQQQQQQLGASQQQQQQPVTTSSPAPQLPCLEPPPRPRSPTRRLAVADADADASCDNGGAAGAAHDHPRTLHYVCWQAAKAGVLPPRAFLRLYLERVPPWLRCHASDVQLAQAVDTLRLLQWVPRRHVREALCGALERRAASSKLPLLQLARWVRQQQ